MIRFQDEYVDHILLDFFLPETMIMLFFYVDSMAEYTHYINSTPVFW